MSFVLFAAMSNPKKQTQFARQRRETLNPKSEILYSALPATSGVRNQASLFNYAVINPASLFSYAVINPASLFSYAVINKPNYDITSCVIISYDTRRDFSI
jgi:hypothetical protein